MAKLFNHLTVFSHQTRLWWFYLVGALFLLLVALFYQYALDEMPCLMCVQVRLLLSLLMIIAMVAIGFGFNKVIRLLSHFASLLVALAMLERSYQLLGTERGFIISDCSFNLGLPSWLAVEQWLPFIYRVETMCGYTPEIAFGITMAEALLVFSLVFVIFTGLILIAIFTTNYKENK